VITAPQPAHVPLAIEAMRAGKHVLVEKPLAKTVAEGREAIAVAEETGKVLMVSQQYRNYPAVRKAAQMIADKHFGDVGTLRVDFRKWANTAPREGHKHYFIPHPLIFDMSIHHFDLMRCILQREPVSVYARSLTRLEQVRAGRGGGHHHRVRGRHRGVVPGVVGESRQADNLGGGLEHRV
jgi:predicted dehydrogenase